METTKTQEPKPRVRVEFVSINAGTVCVKVDGLTSEEHRKLRAIIDNRVRRFAKNLNGKEVIEMACKSGKKCKGKGGKKCGK